jgi:hypothetical protein
VAVGVGHRPADVSREQYDDGPAAVGLRLAQVGLEVRLAKPLAGPVGEGRDRVRAHAQLGRGGGRGQAVDLGEPQHPPPPGGQTGERVAQQALLQPGDGAVFGPVERHDVG